MPSISDGQQLRVIDLDLENGPQYHDYAHPWFVARDSDPQISVVCTQYCSDKVTKMRIPAKARPGNSGDAHITVIQPDGKAIDTWSTTWPNADWTDGATMTAKTVTDCGNFYTGSGTSADGYASTVSGFCNQAGTVNFNEAFSGIHHALFLLVKCGDTKFFRYPSHNYFDTPCTDGQPSFVAGDHVWLDLSDAQIDALSGLPGTANDAIWQKNVLKALHHYGGYIGDHGYDDSHAGAPQILFEDSGSYTALGIEAPWQTYAKANGWTLTTFGTAHVWQFADPWNPLDDAHVGGWRAHLHIIDPCYAKGTC